MSLLQQRGGNEGQDVIANTMQEEERRGKRGKRTTNLFLALPVVLHHLAELVEADAPVAVRIGDLEETLDLLDGGLRVAEECEDL